MGKISKIPQGYLDMVGTETGGKNPSFAPETQQPTVDMTPFLHAQGMSSHNFTFGPVGVLDSRTEEVPADEVWFLYGIGVSLNIIAANDMGKYQIASNNIGTQGDTGFIQLANFTCDSAATGEGAGDRIVRSRQFPVPIPLIHGNTIVAILTDTSVPVRSISVSLLIARFTG